MPTVFHVVTLRRRGRLTGYAIYRDNVPFLEPAHPTERLTRRQARWIAGILNSMRRQTPGPRRRA